MGMSEWQLVRATTADIMQWSYGQVQTVKDLYSARIFGPTRDLCCDCGELSGAKSVGRICHRCGVIVAENSASVRRSRLGHMRLAFFLSDPLSPDRKCDVFPIAPIAYRLSDGVVTTFGRKYEALLETNARLDKEIAGTRSLEDWPRRVEQSLLEPLRLIVESILGVTPEQRVPELDSGSLFGLMVEAILHQDEHLSSITRAAAMALRVSAVL